MSGIPKLVKCLQAASLDKSHGILSTANLRSDVRHPRTIFSCQAALTKVISTCQQLILDLMSGIPKTSFQLTSRHPRQKAGQPVNSLF